MSRLDAYDALPRPRRGPGRCVAHGHVEAWCCSLYERPKPTPFLVPAIDITIHGDTVQIGGIGTLRRSMVQNGWELAGPRPAGNTRSGGDNR